MEDNKEFFVHILLVWKNIQKINDLLPHDFFLKEVCQFLLFSINSLISDSIVS